MSFSKETYLKLQQRAMRLLVRRDHSVLELKQKLQKKDDFDEEAFNELVVDFKKRRYLVDENQLSERLASSWKTQGKGRHWINAKLRAKGLPALPLQDDKAEVDQALKLLKKSLRNQSLEALNKKEKARLARSLTSRGYSSEVIRKVLFNNLEMDDA